MYFFIDGGGDLPKNYSDEGGGMRKKSEIGGSYNFQITLLQIPPSPPLPHKKRTVPNAGYPNYIMHRLCAEFHALLACVHIKEKTRFL